MCTVVIPTTTQRAVTLLMAIGVGHMWAITEVGVATVTEGIEAMAMAGATGATELAVVDSPVAAVVDLRAAVAVELPVAAAGLPAVAVDSPAVAADTAVVVAGNRLLPRLPS